MGSELPDFELRFPERKKLEDWDAREHDFDTEMDPHDVHEHEFRGHSGAYRLIEGQSIFIWEWEICRRCHHKRRRPKPHIKKTKKVYIDAGTPVLK